MTSALLLSLGIAAGALGATPSTVVVLHAAHHGDVAADEIRWRSTLLVEPTTSEHVRVPLARPLPPEVALSVDGRGATVERDARGRAVAILAPASDLPWATSRYANATQLVLRARQPLARSGDVTLHAPLAAGAGVQRVTLEGTTPLRFVADAELGIERRIGRSVGVDVTREERRRVDRWLEPDGAHRGERLYLRAGPALVEHGLRGELERAPAQRAEVGIAAALVFGLLLGAGAWLYRRAARQADLDRVDALLEEEFRSLG